MMVSPLVLFLFIGLYVGSWFTFTENNFVNAAATSKVNARTGPSLPSANHIHHVRSNTHGLDEKDVIRWREEIDASLKRNIMGTCKYQTMDYRGPLRANTTDTFLVYRLYPSKHELNSFKHLPPSITQADESIFHFGAKRGYSYEKWLKVETPRWEIPSNHIAQNHQFCLDVTKLAASGKEISYYESFRQVHRAFYVAQIQQAIIHPSGSVWAECGYFMGQENCETRWDYSKEWHGKCMNHLKVMKRSWTDFWDDSLDFKGGKGRKVHPDRHNSTAFPAGSIRDEMIQGCVDTSDLGTLSYSKKALISYHDKVFIISSLWDYNYHHFIADSLSRLAKHYLFLKSNPDIKIHIRHFEDYDTMYTQDNLFHKKSDLMRMRFMDMLGLDPNRFVTGMVIAKEVYLPRNMRCAWVLSDPIEIRQIAKLLIHSAHAYIHNPMNKGKMDPQMSNVVPLGFDQQKEKEKDLERIKNSSQKILIVLQRLSGDFERSWDNTTFAHVIASFQGAFPNHKVIALSESRNDDPSCCLACDITLFTHADVLVGEHGAGLTNMMFMPKGSLVVELVGVMKDVTMPICGYYGPYAAITGHHHYIHTYDREGGGSMKPHIAAERSGKLYQRIREGSIFKNLTAITVVNDTPVSH